MRELRFSQHSARRLHAKRRPQALSAARMSAWLRVGLCSGALSSEHYQIQKVADFCAANWCVESWEHCQNQCREERSATT